MGANGADPGLQALVDRALSLEDAGGDDYVYAVMELQGRGDAETFAAMARLCRSGTPAMQRLGLDVLGQLGFSAGRPFLEQSLPIALGLCLPGIPEPVMATAVRALGHLGDPRALGAVLALAAHDNAMMRFAVATALPWITGDPPDRRAVDALIRLTRDADTDVRDWATFGIGSLLSVDDEAVREALVARLTDSDDDTAGEALVGLAVRQDERSVESVIARLQNERYRGPMTGSLALEAAERKADPRFLPALYWLRDGGWNEDDPRRPSLDRAIVACETETPP